MKLPTLAAFTVGLLASTINAAPTEAAALGSKKNLYLATCTKKADTSCVLLFFCTTDPAQKFSLVALYPNGPISTTNSYPSQSATVANPSAPWEGVKRNARISFSQFTSSIDADANKLNKGEVAGTAKLGTEDFACFKDGTSTFSVSAGLGEDPYSCQANYWCPSIQV